MKMVKCPKCKKGDKLFEHEFRNKTALAMHMKHKHKEEAAAEPPAEPPEEPPVEPKEVTKEELGIGVNPEPEPVEKKVFNCSECGCEVEPDMKQCPNCKEPFDEA